MENIITRIYELLKETNNLIEFEEQVKLLMYDTFTDLVGEVFSNLNEVIKEQKQEEGWKVENNDSKGIQFVFGNVRFNHTLMYDTKGNPRYPLDEWLGLRKRQRQSPLVEVKVAEMASEIKYREVERILKEWTAVNITHNTVGSIVKRVGKAQADFDEAMVQDLEESAELPKGKKEVKYLYTEADGVLVRGLKKKKHIEVSHAILYEGWDKNGRRVSLRNPKVLMTTKATDDFWKEVQTIVAHEYSLEQTQVVSNSDGGPGYSAEKFKQAFSQSHLPIFHQLDAYHIEQAINRAFGYKKTEWKDKIRKALEDSNLDEFKLILDTYESKQEDEKKIKRIGELRTYILNHWEFIQDWRKRAECPPEEARGLGAMESNQRRVTFRMKRRGMHWSKEGAEAMVKIKQGIANGTLREVYLASQKRSYRKQREVKRTVRISQLLRQPTRQSIGVKQGSISLYSAHSSAIGRLLKTIS
jgi:hypothetical protein